MGPGCLVQPSELLLFRRCFCRTRSRVVWECWGDGGRRGGLSSIFGLDWGEAAGEEAAAGKQRGRGREGGKGSS